MGFNSGFKGLSTKVDSRHNIYWCNEKPHAGCGNPLHDLEVQGWAQNHGVRVLAETVNNFRIAAS